MSIIKLLAEFQMFHQNHIKEKNRIKVKRKPKEGKYINSD